MKNKLFLLFFSLAVATAQAQSVKSISILGDSYSTFENYLLPDTNYCWYNYSHPQRGNDVVQVEQTWWHQIIKRDGYCLCVNNSFSGSTICYTGYVDKKTGKHKDYKDCSFVTRVPYLGSPDIILICGGTNDSWCGAPIGEYKYENWTDADLYSFRPAMACMLDGVKRHYPTACIFFILNSDLKESINESCSIICEHYDVPLIRLHDIDKQRNHPSIAGMKSIAEQVMAAISLDR